MLKPKPAVYLPRIWYYPLSNYPRHCRDDHCLYLLFKSCQPSCLAVEDTTVLSHVQ